MQTRYFALFFGIVYTLVGVLGFFPAAGSAAPDDRELSVETLYFSLLGLFDVNILHTLVHLLVGLAGIAAYRAYDTSRAYARGLAVLFGVLAVFGIIPGLDEVFGLIPLYGADILLHAGTALIAAYFGWIAPASDRDRRTSTPVG